MSGGAPSAVLNAMSVDVEDYYHAHALEPWFCRARWETLERRVEAATMRILDAFDARGAKATFFTLGCVAREFPGLTREIVARGHELASHGDAHRRVDSQTEAEFRADVTRARKTLEDVSGAPVLGYRAASFSIGAATPWAYSVLAETGHLYSSSVSPARAGGDGVAATPHRLRSDGVVELPITRMRVLGRAAPTGGGYFRLAPYAPFRRSVARLNRADGAPAIFYYHPWEIDPGQPRARLGPLTRFRHEVNLSAMEGKVDRALRDFRWGSLRTVFASALEAA